MAEGPAHPDPSPPAVAAGGPESDGGRGRGGDGDGAGWEGATGAHDRFSAAEALMPLGDHLEELRARLIRALLGLVPVLLASLYFGKAILLIIVTPAIDALRTRGLPISFQVTSFFEGFNAYLKTSIAVTIMVGAPWVFFQLWRFISPGLFAHERRFVYLLAPLSAVLTVCSALFLYHVMLPVVLLFFVTFNSSLPAPVPEPVRATPGLTLPTVPMLEADPIDPAPGSMWLNRSLSQLRIAIPVEPSVATGPSPSVDPGTAPLPAETASAETASAETATAETAPVAPAPTVLIRGVPLTGDQLITQQYRMAEYVSMVLTFAIAFAAGFQMPVVVLLLGWARVISVPLMVKYRRHAAMVCVILGAVLTPADPFSMLLMAIPLYMLFELGVLLLRWLPASRVGGWGRAPGEPNEDPPI